MGDKAFHDMLFENGILHPKADKRNIRAHTSARRETKNEEKGTGGSVQSSRDDYIVDSPQVDPT
ncbi:Hypothetical protein PHPALM_6274 [Phytophthora palmivora]|uniref:Uncharacterized protein n=1 Tax=Phytophthora palmivora TaxID=4796 RepID=A0A2P4YFL1_9STRA|nr:Hypothetical protein PHPALM_6274 [Phytophthora palmivora]